MSRAAADPMVQTIEDAAYAIADVLHERTRPDNVGRAYRRLIVDLHHAWPDLSNRLGDLVHAAAARPRPTTPRAFTDNPEARANRQHKAQLIAAWADEALDLTPAQLRLLEPALRGSRLAKLLNLTGTPSAETWAHAVQLLEQRRNLTRN